MNSPGNNIGASVARKGVHFLTGVPDGFDAFVIADIARLSWHNGEPDSPLCLVHVVRDDRRLATLANRLSFFAPDFTVLRFPSWDCLPYDRVSPGNEVVSQRVATLSTLARADVSREAPVIVLTTVSALLQRVPPRDWFTAAVKHLVPGQLVDMQQLTHWLVEHGYERVSTVRDPGNFTVRGGILDLFPPTINMPIRLDFFGDSLESLRTFDADSQRTISQLHRFDLLPASEINFSNQAIRRFRSGYYALFGTQGCDPLYETVSAGKQTSGVEHWLPLFYDKMETLFDYVGLSIFTFDDRTDGVRTAYLEQVAEHYQSRLDNMSNKAWGMPYNPLPFNRLYIDQKEWETLIVNHPSYHLRALDLVDDAAHSVINMKVKCGRQFAAERSMTGINLFDVIVAHIRTLGQGGHRKVVIACRSEETRSRMSNMLADHQLGDIEFITDWLQMQSVAKGRICLAVLDLEAGYESDDLAFICEQDIFGDNFLRVKKQKKHSSNFLKEVIGLSVGDLVVHVDHGIGRFAGLKTLDVEGSLHDCLELVYADRGKLYLPVENIELLSRYGSSEMNVQLDRLGAASWQSRKARLKEHIFKMAGELIDVAAARQLRDASILTPPDGMFDEFCIRFPFGETEDQAAAIDSVLQDMASGRPMDRLICGDVGFGKTEVALRAAFVAVMSGQQVAVVVPTTLLARQHFHTFVERFQGFPVRIEQVTRFVSTKGMADIKSRLKSGDIDIVIGTHSLLGTSISFRNLGLLIIDEEQHFGVSHKEHLKRLCADVHVLTLTATPIPRTLQLALSGVRELSIIASPPIDRLAVRTFVMHFDPIVLREALLREQYRGGQTFYICPRITDIKIIQKFLSKNIPEVKVAAAHGKMIPSELEDVMHAFYERQFDVLLATTIVESGIDVPSANTMIVHRADLFGLAQLYQLRGRVGRSKVRAYAFLTLSPDKQLNNAAEKRLKVLQSLDTLGSGFALASYDLDIRGTGNMLGEEQSGHIKEVGFELYQQMLEEEVARLRGGNLEDEGQWSPQISIGASICIPDHYIADLDLRLSLYRRLSALKTEQEIAIFGEEMVDRFGSMPNEVKQLLRVVMIKIMCWHAGIEKVGAGSMGVVITFRKHRTIDTTALLDIIAREGNKAKLRPDHSIVIKRNWDEIGNRFDGIEQLVCDLGKVVISDEVEAPRDCSRTTI